MLPFISCRLVHDVDDNREATWPWEDKNEIYLLFTQVEMHLSMNSNEKYSPIKQVQSVIRISLISSDQVLHSSLQLVVSESVSRCFESREQGKMKRRCNWRSVSSTCLLWLDVCMSNKEKMRSSRIGSTRVQHIVHNHEKSVKVAFLFHFLSLSPSLTQAVTLKAFTLPGCSFGKVTSAQAPLLYSRLFTTLFLSHSLFNAKVFHRALGYCWIFILSFFLSLSLSLSLTQAQNGHVSPYYWNVLSFYYLYLHSTWQLASREERRNTTRKKWPRNRSSMWDEK